MDDDFVDPYPERTRWLRDQLEAAKAERAEEAGTSVTRPKWQEERGNNHDHPAYLILPENNVQAMLRLEEAWENGVETALDCLAPFRQFVIERFAGESITFYEVESGAPTVSEPFGDYPEFAVCYGCNKWQPYIARGLPPEQEVSRSSGGRETQPIYELGNCKVCGSEVIVRSRAWRRIVGGQD